MSVQATPLRAVLIPAGSTAGISQPINCRDYPYLAVYYSSVGTTSGGTIILEEADYDPTTDPIYGGTWSQIESRAASSFTGGVALARHLDISAYAYVRARISSAITGGGSIKVVLRGTS